VQIAGKYLFTSVIFLLAVVDRCATYARIRSRSMKERGNRYEEKVRKENGYRWRNVEPQPGRTRHLWLDQLCGGEGRAYARVTEEKGSRQNNQNRCGYVDGSITSVL
jgi:hypothetical protein